jgi:hypothetical protein
MTPPLTVHDDLTVSRGRTVVAHLQADEALDLAARLARCAFRRIAVEEGAGDIFNDVSSRGGGRRSQQ